MTTETLGLIDDIDLTSIRERLGGPHGPGWDDEETDRVEREYRRYLAMIATGAEPVPSKIVDTMWHAHIVDTRAYAADCDAMFGRYIHHFPYFGMRDEADAQALADAYAATLALYEDLFGEEPPEDLWPRAGAARCPNCGRR